MINLGKAGDDPSRLVWTRDRYHLAARQGVFQPDERVELLDGEVISKEPAHPRHSAAVYKASRNLEALFGNAYIVRTEAPVILSNLSEPEPDICVVSARDDLYADSHPVVSEVRLLIEVSETTLNYDRGLKAISYAVAGIPEYWILDLVEERLEIYRNPDPVIGYRVFELLTATDHAAALFAQDRQVAVKDLLPKLKTV